MNRRAFLQSLATVAAGVVLDPEMLLWRPGVKRIFLPSPPSLLAPIDLWPADMFMLEGVNAINPMTWRHTEHLQYFIVTEFTRKGESVTPHIWPRPVAEGPYQNVSRLPFRNAQVIIGRTGRPLP